MKISLFIILFLITLNPDASSQWINQSFSEPYNLSFSSSFFFNENTGFLPNSAPQNLIARTTNSGTNWFLDTFLVGRLTSIAFAKNRGVILHIAFPPSRSYLFTTLDSGINWSTGVQVSNNFIYSIKLIDSNTIIGSADSGKIYRSSNFGNDWIEINTGAFSTRMLDIHFPSPQTGYVVGGFQEPKWFKTTNGGFNWFQGGHLSSFELYRVLFLNNDTGFITSAGSVIRRTTNGGFTWTSHSVGSSGEIRAIYFPSNDTGYALSNAQIGPKNYTTYFLRTTDGGETWSSNQLSFTSFMYTLFFVNNETGWIAGGGSRIYKTTTGGLTFISNIGTEIPDKFYLHQNYPNPFNPATNIRFNIPVNSSIRLSVFDLLGREIVVLHDGEISAGEYEYTFNAKDLSSGIYFYKLQSERFTSVKRMVLSK